jgi:hypothetical protein
VQTDDEDTINEGVETRKKIIAQHFVTYENAPQAGNVKRKVQNYGY